MRKPAPRLVLPPPYLTSLLRTRGGG